jgi:hypothetical protein
MPQNLASGGFPKSIYKAFLVERRKQIATRLNQFLGVGENK